MHQDGIGTGSSMVAPKQQSDPKKASQVVQWVKNLPAVQEMQEIRVRFLGREDPLEEGMAAQYSCQIGRAHV